MLIAGSGHLSGLFARCVCPLVLMKSAYRVPIRLSDFDALTVPRGVPAAVPFDHHHSRLPLHLIAAMSGAACPSVVQMAGAAL